MNKFVSFLFLLAIVFFGLVDSSEATWATADDFSDQQLKIIARKIIVSEKGKLRINNHIIPTHKDLDGSNTTTSQGAPLSYFRLNNHRLDIYQNIIDFVITNGTVVKGKERYDNRFSILATIPDNQLSQFGAKENNSIGAWMQGANYKKVRKVKAVFSVMNMKAEMKDLSSQELNNAMDQKKSELDKPAGDLLTVFPIPDTFNF